MVNGKPIARPDDTPLTEEDVKHRFIAPAIKRAGWEDALTRLEYAFTAGRIRLEGNVPRQGPLKKADFLLWSRAETAPLAVVEAKAASRPANYGLQQAKDYATILDVPFAYSSNGREFVEYDFLTGLTRTFPMEDFPSPEALFARFCAGGKLRPPLSEPQRAILDQPYHRAIIDPKLPRYYQVIAVNRAVDAFVAGRDRLLLTLATGTGKTFIAFQIVWRLLKAGQCARVLYLTDRIALADQTLNGDFQPLANVCHRINVKSDRKESATAYNVYFGLYQQLIGENGALTFTDLFPPDFFDLVIVDECHRGSANENSQWRKVLDYFASARQLGMTATPKETQDASNSAYFGKPLYAYKLAQGIDDGYLAPFRVRVIQTNIGDGWRPAAGQLDFFGVPIPDRVYDNSDYDVEPNGIVLLDRIREVARIVTDALKASGDRMAKTIVFCPTEKAAARLAEELGNQNADLMQVTHGDYVACITANHGGDKIAPFASINAPTPVIATTSKLLSTGVDTKMVKFIVIDKPIQSMTEFKQILGRGTRLVPKHDKRYFTLLDLRGVSKLFADPDWDGDPEPDPDYAAGEEGGAGGETGKPPSRDPPSGPSAIPIVSEEGCPVHVVSESNLHVASDGKLVAQEDLRALAKRCILARWPDAQAFHAAWLAASEKATLAAFSEEDGLDLRALRNVLLQADADFYDVIAHFAYGRALRTAAERAHAAKRAHAFTRWKDPACRDVLCALLERYERQGPDVITDRATLTLPDLATFGAPQAIAARFGGPAAYSAAVSALRAALYRDLP